MKPIERIKIIDGITFTLSPSGVVAVDANNISAKGGTIKEARLNLVLKIADRDAAQYKGVDMDIIRDVDYLYQAYRQITGTCHQGASGFISQNHITNPMSLANLVQYVRGKRAYRSEVFEAFFERSGQS